MWRELIEIMDDLRRIYQGLASLEQKKHRALVTVDLPQVETLTKEEQLLINQVTKLEAKRRGVVLRLAARQYDQAYELTFGEVIDMAPAGAVRGKLQKLQESLAQSVQATKEQNEINSILARGALNAVEANLNKLGGARVLPNYGNGGQTLVTRHRNFEYDA